MDKFSGLKAIAEKAKELGGINNYKKGKDAVAAFQAAATPAAILALLAELEASKTNAEYYKSAFEEQRDHADQLEKRLATPVRLPELCGDGENDNEYTEGLNDGINQSAKAIRAAGFTVEGDE
ncbi:hypothetical protein M2407_000054 [Serratia sp. BIGb0234]|uniref:hypothetical protein n=1 Tax=Serratia sp. BIGb0234 TaxID=2940614 RepID=UPI002168123D|nr:hypothetical protein [Serratia sp. BIGb0234]MCS4315755.1 hypothetical protein [Serratia sp. BIGb0234]